VSVTKLARRFALIAALSGTVLTTASTAASAIGSAPAAKSLTDQQLLSVVKHLDFAPAGFYTSAHRATVRPLPAGGACGDVQPASTQAMTFATSKQWTVTVAINQMKDAATAAKAYHSMIMHIHQCKGSIVGWPLGLPYNVRSITQISHGKVLRATLVTVEGNALVFSQLQHPGKWTAHDLWVEHRALHMAVAAYRSAIRA
jgi:hypothetical protein